MSEKDRERWDAKWQSRLDSPFEPHPLLLRKQELLAGDGFALDLACGRGQNSLWLARLGYDVLGVDISRVALKAAKADASRHGLSERLRFEQVDLDA
jgi:2-polyprenyl-3-methyl-5-hydroxy-6-metoxy-1,4-benzoquinol methylase